MRISKIAQLSRMRSRKIYPRTETEGAGEEVIPQCIHRCDCCDDCALHDVRVITANDTAHLEGYAAGYQAAVGDIVAWFSEYAECDSYQPDHPISKSALGDSGCRDVAEMIRAKFSKEAT